MEIISQKKGNDWYEYSLINNNGMVVSFLNYGGIITEMLVPNKHNQKENIVLSYHDYLDYTENSNYLGAIIGRVAGRIKNASFKLDDKVYNLSRNENPHHIHGGNKGFHNTIWKVHTFRTNDSIGATLRHYSPDGENGFPGNIISEVTYILSNENEFHIEYQATTDKLTVLSLTNHTYFNLSGDLKNGIHNHFVKIKSNKILELDDDLIPTGKWIDVKDTSFDFNDGQQLNEGLNPIHPQNKLVGNGYDHYYQFNDSTSNQVIVKEENSGRVMQISTTQPGMVMYTSNALGTKEVLKTKHSSKHLGVCFETQAPSAALWQHDLPKITLSPNEKYYKKTVYSFDIKYS